MRILMVILLAVVVLLGTTASIIHARSLEVPSSYEEIHLALASATPDSSDTVFVSHQNDDYEPFTMKAGVPVVRKAGQATSTISAGTGTHAVAFPSDADASTVLEGFNIERGDTIVILRGAGVIRDCAVTTDTTNTVYGIYHTSTSGTTGLIEGVSVELDSLSALHSYVVGVYLYDSDVEIDGCDVVVERTSYGIRQQTSGPSGLMLAKITNTFVYAPDGYGMIVSTLGTSDTTLVENCTIADPHDVGIYDESGVVKINHCIVTTDGHSGIYGYGPLMTYCMSPQGFLVTGDTTGQGLSTEEPFYCDEANGKYALRVDSYGNPENNASGKLIGKYSVACMYGTLTRTCTFAGSGTLAMTDSVVVPSGKTLTLEKATTVNVDELSPTSPLLVEGTLRVNGESGDEVVFQSAEASPGEGDWYGIKVEADDKAFLEYATIQHANYGLYLDDPDSVSVDHCAFTSNQTADIIVSDIGSSDYGLIQNSTITVGGGSAIKLFQSADGVTISNNTITGNSSSTHGINTDSWFSGSPTISGNTIEGFTNGSCVRISLGSPTLTTNTLQNSKYGIELVGGSPSIGTSSSSSDNTITGNSTGIHHDGASVTAVIRNNQITSNTYGVVNKSGDPNLGGRDGIGNGNNTLTGNTTYCLWNRSRSAADTLWSQGNYYGTCTGGQPPWCWSGLVVYTSALCTQPASVIADIIAVTGNPKGFRLLGAWPNPMTAANEISFALDEGNARVSVHIFDVAGRLVRELPETEYGPGQHAIHWDGRNRGGDPVQSGIYFIRLAGTNGLNATAKVLVAR